MVWCLPTNTTSYRPGKSARTREVVVGLARALGNTTWTAKTLWATEDAIVELASELCFVLCTSVRLSRCSILDHISSISKLFSHTVLFTCCSRRSQLLSLCISTRSRPFLTPALQCRSTRQHQATSAHECPSSLLRYLPSQLNQPTRYQRYSSRSTTSSTLHLPLSLSLSAPASHFSALNLL